jgi:hypothetical protein
MQWNLSCEPPWTEKELRHKVADAMKQPGPNGYLVGRPAETRIQTWRPFPVDILPNPIRLYVKEASAAIGCDPTMIALPLLTCAATAIGNSRTIRLKRGWCEPPILWTGVVAESGTHKSPAHHQATKILFENQNQAIRAYQEAVQEFERKQQEYDADYSAWKSSGRKKGEPAPEKPKEPICNRCIASETTVEALADRLQSAPRGLGVLCDELNTWLNGFNQYKGGRGGDVGHWLTMHGGRPLLIDRKTGARKTISVPRASVSVAGGIQPATLRRSLTQEYMENGLGPRLLLAMPPRRRKRWTEEEVDESTERLMASVLERLLALEFGEDDRGNPLPVEIPLTAGAKEVFVDFYNQHADEQANLRGNDAAVWSKIEAYATRFALIFHLVRCAAENRDLESPDSIDTESMTAAISMAAWFGEESRRIFAVLLESDEERETRELIELIDHNGGEISARELMRQLRRRFRTSDDANAALQLLVNGKRGTWRPIPPAAAGGAPTRVFMLNEEERGDTTPVSFEEIEVMSPSPAESERIAGANESGEEVCEWSA